MSTKNILYIGRFQPFHRGHADAVMQIMEDIIHWNNHNDGIERYNVFIGIGSAETNFTETNPLTSGERFEIIDEAWREIIEQYEIENDRIAVHIVPIRNIDHYVLWPYHVQQYIPTIDVVYSGSPLVLQLWKKCFSEKKIVHLQKRIAVSGTIVREVCCNEDNTLLEQYVLPSTALLLEKFHITKRLKNMKTY